MKSMKRTLISSVIALILCFAMFVGSTFAWFTDSVTSANNKIVAGNLDVDLYLWTSATSYKEITDNQEPIFGVDETALVAGTARAQDDASNTLWEPGKTQVVYLSIKNNGTLDMKYKVALNVANPAGGKDLYKVLEYAITGDAKYSDTDPAWNGGIAVETGVNATQANDVALKAGEEHFFALSVHMLESAGNEYMNGSVIFDIQVLAGQLASESDSFGTGYDENAAYPGVGFATIDRNQSYVEVVAKDLDNKYNAGNFIIPTEAVEDGVNQVSVAVNDSAYVGNFSIAAGMEKKVYDIVATGLKEGNTAKIKSAVKIPTGLNPETVKVYHYDELIDSDYNPNTGYVTFETTSFSPFTFVYDADSKYEIPESPKDETGKVLYPTATVTYYTDIQNIEWGNYGQWSPTAGLEANLEAAYTFACPDYANASAEEKAIIDAYRYWYCDFFVSLDGDLGENEIFLGGNYGDFGWIGFHNGNLTLPANTELPLLSSVTTNPWTYDDVENFVGEFICGVGDVNDALAGKTFTVKLRLINPKDIDTSVENWWTTLDASQYVDVNVVSYTFGGNSVIDGVQHVTTAEGLQEAVNNGGTTVLENDIDLSQGIVIPGN